MSVCLPVSPSLISFISLCCLSVSLSLAVMLSLSIHTLSASLSPNHIHMLSLYSLSLYLCADNGDKRENNAVYQTKHNNGGSFYG